MLNKRLYTFIVASHANAKLWRLSIPYPILIGIGFFALIGLAAAFAASYHYGRMLLKVKDYNNILVENDSFRSENHNYRIQTAQLGEKIDFLDTTSRKLMTMTSMNSLSAVGGVGGYPKEGFVRPSPAVKGTLKSIEVYNKSIRLLEDRYRGLNESISEKLLLAGSWPAFLPVKGYITASIGSRVDPFNGSFSENHMGLDISAPYGSSIYAPADGIVIFSGPREGFGNMVVIDHKFGVATRYGHLSKINVDAGQRILRSDVIGYVGTTGRTTGSHLHYEMWVNDRPVNPQEWLSPK